MRKTADQLGLRLEAKGRPLLALVAGVLFLAAVVGAIVIPDSGDDSNQATATTTVPDQIQRRHVEGFSGIGFTVTTSEGERRNNCALLADNDTQRSKGLMNMDDLAGYNAMIFRFPSNVQAQFYMANVRFPLSIAWFDDQGRFVSSADMPKCEVAAEDCPLYGASGPYRYALEVAQGGLGDLGIGEGSVLQLGSLCS